MSNLDGGLPKQEIIELRSRIKDIMVRIRKATPKSECPDWRYPSDLRLRDDFLYGERIHAASITLFPSGCQYAAKGGCTMCGEWSGSNLGELVSPEFHVAQFAAACSDTFSKKEIQWLRIYQEGSFINEREVDPDAQKVILQLASNLRGIQRVTIETRPEFLTSQKAATVRGFIRSPVEILIGIGLEAKNDFIRNICIGKMNSLEVYENAIKIAHANNILTLAYVLFKPPFLSEGESFREAVQTVSFAFEIGFDEVYIQAASIHEWSLSELLALQGMYSLPWLWSLIGVVKETAHLGKVKIGGLEYFPHPLVISQNYKDVAQKHPCECSEKIWELIQEYNAIGDIGLFYDVNCSCFETWQKSLETKEIEPLGSRVKKILSLISVEDYLQHKKGMNIIRNND